MKLKYMNPYNSKLRANKVKYSTSDGPFIINNDVKVTFIMTEFYIRKNITQRFHVDKIWGDYGISYDMIILCDLMLQLSPKASFGHQIL